MQPVHLILLTVVAYSVQLNYPPPQPFFRDYPGELVPGENFWTLWCKERLTEADKPTIRQGNTPSGLTSAHLLHPHIFFLQAGCPSCHPTNSIKTLKAKQGKIKGCNTRRCRGWIISICRNPAGGRMSSMSTCCTLIAWQRNAAK